MGAGRQGIAQIDIPFKAIVVVPPHGTPVAVPHQVAIDVEPGFAEQAGKADVERLAGLSFAYLDIRAVPDKAIVLAAIGRSNSLDFHVEVGA